MFRKFIRRIVFYQVWIRTGLHYFWVVSLRLRLWFIGISELLTKGMNQLRVSESG